MTASLAKAIDLEAAFVRRRSLPTISTHGCRWRYKYTAVAAIAATKATKISLPFVESRNA
jgi:hypothetical protein